MDAISHHLPALFADETVDSHAAAQVTWNVFPRTEILDIRMDSAGGCERGRSYSKLNSVPLFVTENALALNMTIWYVLT